MKKKATKPRAAIRSRGQRIDAKDFGIDLDAILNEIRPHLDGSYDAIGERAGGMTAATIANVLGGFNRASLGTVAALAAAAGGKLEVTFSPPSPQKKAT
jgi:hypothetical protein